MRSGCSSNSSRTQASPAGSPTVRSARTSSTSHFRGRKIAIEVDGFAFHTDAEVFQHDRNRQNYLVLNGWQILRFTWQDLVEHPERVIAEIRRVISV